MLLTPGQEIVTAPSWSGASLIYILRKLGLTSGLQFCLDAGDANSYASGQKWLDTSGNGLDFFLGAGGSASSDDPAFNGTAGRLSASEYFSWDNADGNDRFTYDTTNETWMETLHKDDAIFSAVALVQIASNADQAIVCTGNLGNAANPGVTLMVTSGGVLQLRVGGTPGFALVQNAAAAVATGVPHVLGVSLNEAAGAGGINWMIDATAETDPSTYASPSSDAAFTTFKIGVNAGGGAFPLTTGSRMWGLAMWSGVALGAAQLQAIRNAVRPRFGI